MISEIMGAATAVSALTDAGSKVGSGIKTATNTATSLYEGYKDAKAAIMSIAEKSRKSIMMYKVLVSASIREADLAMDISKYLETMYAIFTMLVLGYNPMAKDNSEVNSIIKGISAESFKADSEHKIELETLKKASVYINNSVDFGNRTPRIGKNFRSEEATNQAANQTPGQNQNKNKNKVSNDNTDTVIHNSVSSGHGNGNRQGYYVRPVPSFQNNSNNSHGRYANVDEVKFMKTVDLKTDGTVPSVISMKVRTGNGEVNIPIAVKCNVYPITSEDMRLIIESSISTSITGQNLLRNIKWKSGEISTLAYIFKTDENERNAKLYKNLGRNPWFIELQQRKNAAKQAFWGRFLTRFGSSYYGATSADYGKARDLGYSVKDASRAVNASIASMPPTASLIVTKEDLVAATRLDISHFTKNEGFVERFMRDAFLLCFGIVDLASEQVQFFFMGYKTPFIVTFNDLKKKQSNQNDALFDAIKELSRKV